MEKKRKNLAVLAETPRLKRFFFSAKLLSSNVKTVALTRAPENCRWKSRHKFRSTFYTQPGWPYWHVDFPVFLFVISGSWFLFGWMWFLAVSLSSLWKYFFLARYTSAYIISSLLAANCMCSWAPCLLDCKPRPIKSFHGFMRLAMNGGLHCLFFYFIERHRWRSVFSWLRFLDQILLSHSILFNITCTSVTGGIIINIRQL